MDDQQIIASWLENGDPWTIAVRERRIRSRVLVTDAAIVAAVRARSPRTMLDIGCGEGWLAREFAGLGVDVLGIDVVPALIENARRQGGGRFEIMTYEALAERGLLEKFDVCVCNFSLLGAEVTNRLVAALPAMLAPGGALIVQTLHPWTASGDEAYRDGWRAGSWSGINGEFGEPAPWYFRTLQNWMQLFSDAGLRVESILEPLHPHMGRPASMILIGTPIS